jgi:Ras-related protein Rab-6A
MDKYQDFQKEQLKLVDILLLVYDVTDKQSFEDIENWFKMIQENSSGRQVVLAVIGNKSDLINER